MREKTSPRPVSRPVKPVARDAGRTSGRSRFSALRLPGGGFTGVQGRTRGFLRDTRSELKKVVWPSREEAINLTLIVIAVSVVIGLVLGAVDYVFQILFEVLVTG